MVGRFRQHGRNAVTSIESLAMVEAVYCEVQDETEEAKSTRMHIHIHRRCSSKQDASSSIIALRQERYLDLGKVPIAVRTSIVSMPDAQGCDAANVRPLHQEMVYAVALKVVVSALQSRLSHRAPLPM
jgi:hypothetical protein